MKLVVFAHINELEISRLGIRSYSTRFSDIMGGKLCVFLDVTFGGRFVFYFGCTY